MNDHNIALIDMYKVCVGCLLLNDEAQSKPARKLNIKAE